MSLGVCPEELLNPVFALNCDLFMSQMNSPAELKSVERIGASDMPNGLTIYQYRVKFGEHIQVWDAAFDTEGDIIFLDFEEPKE